jgi:predicted DNA-binding protein (MmcQ/YjbR family)
MNIEAYREFCLTLPGVTEDLPFDESTLAFRVKGKIFVFTNLDTFESVNLKCEPEKALELRQQYASVKPGYHMNKKHWNTVEIHGDVSGTFLKELTIHSYERVVAGLPKKEREALQQEEDYPSGSGNAPAGAN